MIQGSSRKTTNVRSESQGRSGMTVRNKENTQEILIKFVCTMRFTNGWIALS